MDRNSIINAARVARRLGEILEPMLDNEGLPAVLDALAFICSEKADHVRSSWQDEATAKVWEDMAGQILGVEFKAAAAFRA